MIEILQEIRYYMLIGAMFYGVVYAGAMFLLDKFGREYYGKNKTN